MGVGQPLSPATRIQQRFKARQRSGSLPGGGQGAGVPDGGWGSLGGTSW